MAIENSGRPKLMVENENKKHISFLSTDYVFPIVEDELATEWTKITLSSNFMISENILTEKLGNIRMSFSKDLLFDCKIDDLELLEGDQIP